jgi:hypothetical protein
VCDLCFKTLVLPRNQYIDMEDVLGAHRKEYHSKSFYRNGHAPATIGSTDGADDSRNETGDVQDDDAVEDEAEAELEAAEAEAADAQEADTEDSEPETVELEETQYDEVEVEGEVEGEEITVEVSSADDTNGTKPITITINANNVPAGKLDPIEWISNPRTAYPEEYRIRQAKWRREDVKKRLDQHWNIHNAALFSPDFEVEAAKCESDWDNAFHDAFKPKKRDAPDPSPYPLPYKTAKVDKGQFLEVQAQELDNLINLLRSADKHSAEELYAVAQTGALAMKTIQDEYLALDNLYLKANRHRRDEPTYETKKHQLQGHKKKGGPPLARVTEDVLDFREKKEAMLYGYKHQHFPGNTPLVPIRTPQDPFVQGGFVPTPAQARKMIAKQKELGDRNMDNWVTMKRHGLEYHPQLYEPRSEPLVPKITRKRKAAEVELPTKTPDTEETQNESGDDTEDDNHAAKKRTRTRGGKRVVVESANNSDSNSRRGAGRGRGRGRGRGGIGRIGPARASFEVSPAPTTQPSARGRGRRGASAMASSTTPTAESSFPVNEPAATESPTDQSQAPAKKEAMSAEAIEEARRQKIANSKNPKRTKAMLDHWDRFNREGRIRNPKRSKAQIEQDRTVDGPDDSIPHPMGPGSGPGRPKRSPSLVPLAGNLAPKAPGLPSMASVQAQQHMPPSFPPMGVPHYGPGPVNPYGGAPVAPMAQLGQPMPPQYAPFPYVQYGMGHLPGPHNPRDPRH